MSDVLLPLASNLQLVDDLYERFLADPAAVDATWRRVFTSWEATRPDGNGAAQPKPAQVRDLHPVEASSLVRSYRARGHLEARLDPLDALKRDAHPELDPKTYGFHVPEENELLVDPDGRGPAGPEPLAHLLQRLRNTYCGPIGVEFMHISAPDRRRWLEERMEPTENKPTFGDDVRRRMLAQLISATELERFIDAKYVGSKRFSLEGGETLIPLLHQAIDCAGAHGVEEMVLGMAHRGRLNVLVNVLGMPAAELFAEFEDFDPEATLGGGDVKYHLGYSQDHTTSGGHKLHLSLSFNPSHLEAVDPVVVGRVRAKQRRRHDNKHQKVCGILVHGDAAFAGQGLVAETLNLSDLRGYRTGGTLHVVVNNQIGFTTSPTDSRSTPYCTDVAKMIQCPIFHVNGDDPDAVATVTRLAMDYRREFSSDVVIDMFCFRRHGHNEIDEPSFTQPLLYERIKQHPAVYEIYGRSLVERGVVAQADLEKAVADEHRRFGEALERARSLEKRPSIEAMGGVWAGYLGGPESSVRPADTRVPLERVTAIAQRLSTLPDGFHAHPKVVRLFEARAAMGRGERPVDWAMAEALSWGTLVWEGHLVRMSGQDIRRGTFSQRHATVVDVGSGEEYTPLKHVREPQGEFRIYDSSLSEAAVLGFELGYSLDMPEGLVLWEAQFGDFANGAQVILDQFVSASEDRWKRLSGLVLLLPHGYEGQGPEHSSARLERYLQLCAEDNWQVAQPSTPAQYYHLLRRQVLRRWRKPLVILTPKSMLRLPAAVSSLTELADGQFHAVLDDPEPPPPLDVERVMLCTGKLYYELVEERRRRGDKRTAIVRIEQLYPLDIDSLIATVERYARAREIIWVQEEPANMGAHHFLKARFRYLARERGLRAVCRNESASPATGSAKAHLIEQRALLDEAFGK